ncbi:MAG: hypothetical protein HY735_11290 [Verrucomicrobia bacterium]|nr:hypothetical protein [Verrucomicrobiota bacterium]
MTPDLLCLALGLVIGFGTGWFSYRGRQSALRRAAEEERLSLEKNYNALQIELAKLAERYRFVEDQRQSFQNELAQERQFNISLHAELSRERGSRSHLEQKLEHQKSDLAHFQQRLTHEFRNLVQQLLEEKSQTLSDLTKSNLNQLLQPISDKLQDFKQKIEEQHYRETRELIVLHNKLANIESGRWRQSNGAPTATPGSNAAPHGPANASLAVEAAVSPNAPADDPAPSADAEPNAEDVEEVAAVASSPEPSPESDGFQSFSPKQEVEIDNFLKRTLGRAQRKKPEE